MGPPESMELPTQGALLRRSAGHLARDLEQVRPRRVSARPHGNEVTIESVPRCSATRPEISNLHQRFFTDDLSPLACMRLQSFAAYKREAIPAMWRQCA
jgi:hypothetical protein